MLIPAQWFAHTDPQVPMEARLVDPHAAPRGEGSGPTARRSWATAWDAAAADGPWAGRTPSGHGTLAPARDAAPSVAPHLSAPPGRAPSVRPCTATPGSGTPAPFQAQARALSIDASSDAADPGGPSTIRPPSLSACGTPAWPPQPRVHVERCAGETRIWLGLPAAWGGPQAAERWLPVLRKLASGSQDCSVVCNGRTLLQHRTAAPIPSPQEHTPWT